MAYFKNVKSFEDLKEQFKKLARKHHPDCGGDPEVMKEINAEFDTLFPIWKHRHNATAAEKSNETADETRRHFYTQNGWAGENYDSNKGTKEIAAIIRAYVKEVYPTYKFSVRYSHSSMCSEIHTELVKSPIEIYKPFESLTDDERWKVWRRAESNRYVEPFGCLDDEHYAILKEAYENHQWLKVYNEATQAVIDDVENQVKSYRYDDSDGMIDYFDTNFYYFGVKISGKFAVVEKTARIKNRPEETAPATTGSENPETTAISEEYEIKQDTHDKTGETIYTVKIVRKLSREEYLQVAEYMKSLGGYYSRYKHAFIFKEDPSEKISGRKAA